MWFSFYSKLTTIQNLSALQYAHLLKVKYVSINTFYSLAEKTIMSSSLSSSPSRFGSINDRRCVRRPPTRRKISSQLTVERRCYSPHALASGISSTASATKSTDIRNNNSNSSSTRLVFCFTWWGLISVCVSNKRIVNVNGFVWIIKEYECDLFWWGPVDEQQ